MQKVIGVLGKMSKINALNDKIPEQEQLLCLTDVILKLQNKVTPKYEDLGNCIARVIR